MYSIAIDGPSSSGKSSIATLVAERLNILHLNTGELYRAIGLYAFKNGLMSQLDDNGMAIVKEEEIQKIVDNSHIEVKYIDGKQHTYLNDDDVSDLLHTPIISDYSSRVSAIKEIRQHVLSIQRDIAESNNVVMEGRDITSHVLPNAKYKFFVTASPEVRAQRRLNEMLEKGLKCTYEEILEDLKQRDIRDTTRDVCPLVVVPDAIVLDSTNCSLDEMVNMLLSYIKE